MVGPSTPSHPTRPHQESISDFYWYYSGKDVIEEQGKRNFSKAMSVAKQVFNSLTEYIQVGRSPWGGSGKGGGPASRSLIPSWGFPSRSHGALPPRVPAPGTSRAWRTVAYGTQWWDSCTCSPT